MKKLSFLLAVIMMLSFSACGGGTGTTSNEQTTQNTEQTEQATEETAEPAAEATAKSPDNDLVVAMQADATHLDPHVSGNGVSNTVTNTMYESLVTFDADTNIVPMLAKEWSMSDDGLSYTFVLNEGITFHDGEPFNAEAVIANWERGRSDQSLRIYTQTQSWVSAVADSEYQLTITLDEPNNTFLNKLTQVRIISPKAIEEWGQDGLAKQSAGTGPYILSERVDGGYTKMVRNENYWGEQPYYDEVIVKYIPDASARLQALQSGEIDLIYGSALLTWDDYQQATSLPNIAGAVAESDSKTRNLVLNASGVLSDLRVREAVAYAIDKETLSEGLTYGEETPADHLFPDGIPYTDVELNVVRTYDPEKANALLDEAGWVLNESTGIREKDGQALSLKYTYDSGDALNKSLATAVKSQLAAVGINVETEGQEMMTWWQEGVAGNYDLIMWNTEQPYTSPHNYFIPMLSRSPHVPSLPAVEGSDEFLSLIEEFQTTDDSARVQEIFNQLLNFDNDNVLDLPLLFVKDMIVYNTDKIAGYDFSSTPMFFDVRLIQPAE